MNRSDAIILARILKRLIVIQETSIILNTFLKTFMTKSVNTGDGRRNLYGNFKQGGTKSGRLSSANPNLQNIPSTGTRFAKPIKQCFQAPSDWLMVGIDYDSLEDKISALTTGDPNKLKVYTDGYDGHSLRAYNYFETQMPDIDSSVSSINSIRRKYPTLRQRSKGPTFALTYGGTSYALVNQCGLSLSEAVEIESRYHEMYSISDAWVKRRIDLAAIDGYVTCAFGLRLRTPVLSQVLLDKKSTPYEARSEARTAGNALGQSYGMLNMRAAIEFQERVLKSKWKYEIKPIAAIHDSLYFIIRNRLNLVHWVNKNLVECIEWQNLPELQHPIVKLSGKLSIFYPTWANEISIPNHATKSEIKSIAKKYKKEIR